MVVFLAVRCYSCQTFQVNQKTKSGKWKCRLCCENQSMVKVWGRGERAKDVRGLVMELNAVAGRGDDPNIVLRNIVGGSGPQSRSPSQRPQARNDRNPGHGMRDQDDGCDFSMADRTLPRRRQQYTGGTGELTPVESATWTRSEGFLTRSGGFVPAGLAFGGGRDSTAGERRSAEPLDNNLAGATGYGGNDARGGISFETHPEHTAAAARASTWQPSVEPPRVAGGGGSRWGVYASGQATQALKKRQGPGQQDQVEGDPNFVTSIETASVPERRGKKRAPPSSSGGRRGPPSEDGRMSTSRRALGQHQVEKESTYVATNADVHVREGDHWHHQKARRREWSSSSIAPHTDQADSAMMAMRGGGREQGGRGSVGSDGGGAWGQDRVAPVAQGGAGMPGQRGMLPGEPHGGRSSTSSGGGGYGGVRGTGSSSSSRWSKFIR
ncbi:unnamed protein product [Pylaiella littoralis]